MLHRSDLESVSFRKEINILDYIYVLFLLVKYSHKLWHLLRKARKNPDAKYFVLYNGIKGTNER